MVVQGEDEGVSIHGSSIAPGGGDGSSSVGGDQVIITPRAPTYPYTVPNRIALLWRPPGHQRYHCMVPGCSVTFA